MQPYNKCMRAGTMIASVAQLASCGLNAASGYEIKAYTKCTSWKQQANPSLQFAFAVNGVSLALPGSGACGVEQCRAVVRGVDRQGQWRLKALQCGELQVEAGQGCLGWAG